MQEVNHSLIILKIPLLSRKSSIGEATAHNYSKFFIRNGETLGAHSLIVAKTFDQW